MSPAQKIIKTDHLVTAFDIVTVVVLVRPFFLIVSFKTLFIFDLGYTGVYAITRDKKKLVPIISATVRPLENLPLGNPLPKSIPYQGRLARARLLER